MTIITVQCRLKAPEATRRTLWQLMAGRNTPLINRLIELLRGHSDLNKWKDKGKLPAGVVGELCKTLKTDPLYNGQPSYAYKSAEETVKEQFESVLAIHLQLKKELYFKTRRLAILKSDAELIELSGLTVDDIRKRAGEVLSGLKDEDREKPIGPLYRKYELLSFDDPDRWAVCYLLKNGGKLRKGKEDPEKFEKRRRKLEIKIERLTARLDSCLPGGRDLTGEAWRETLNLVATHDPDSAETAKLWQDELLRQPAPIPYPLNYNTSEILVWSEKPDGRLRVTINGNTFDIYCDERQLSWFRRFYEDQKVKREGKNSHSAALFTLRSARVGWRVGEGKGEPWNVNALYLYCTVDTELWTAEGTARVIERKRESLKTIIESMSEKDELSDTQKDFFQRKKSTLARLNKPYPRPHRETYQGKANIVVGVALGLDKPARAAVVDCLTGKALTYRSTRQLLGENYGLLNRQRYQKQQGSRYRHKAQRKGASPGYGESQLGQYIDRLLAKAIVELAREYDAGSIAVPHMENMREIVQAELQARAEAKIPGYLEGQKEYAKQYRTSVHGWSYGRLIESIRTGAGKLSIVLESGAIVNGKTQQDKARELALKVYANRNTQENS